MITPKEELKTDLEGAVYQAAVKYFERGEHRDILRGNGHHMAQELVRHAGEIFERHAVRQPLIQELQEEASGMSVDQVFPSD